MFVSDSPTRVSCAWVMKLRWSMASAAISPRLGRGRSFLSCVGMSPANHGGVTETFSRPELAIIASSGRENGLEDALEGADHPVEDGVGAAGAGGGGGGRRRGGGRGAGLRGDGDDGVG